MEILPPWEEMGITQSQYRERLRGLPLGRKRLVKRSSIGKRGGQARPQEEPEPKEDGSPPKKGQKAAPRREEAGKGGKERIVPFGASAQRALLRYLLHFRPEPFNLAVQNSFLTLDGRPLTQNTMKLIFQRIARRSGVKRLHPHLCRHTFATTYLINGGDVFTLQQILGHTTLEMVRRYVTLASAQVTVQHRKFSPLDRMSLQQVKQAVAMPEWGRRAKPDLLRRPL